MALGWGIIGIGKLADIAIAPAIAKQPDSCLAAVCSRDTGRAQEFAQRHDALSAYGDYDKMVNDPSVDVVYIASPNALHKDHALAAFRAGKHVFVEKPMALSLEDGYEMVAAASSADVTFAVGFHLRHKPTALAARDMIRREQIGRVFFADISVGSGKGLYPYHTWRADPALSGGGTLLHQGTHAIDLLGFFTDHHVVEVACLTDTDAAEDVFAATCRLDDGMLATISSHQLRPGTRPDWALFGEDGWLEGSCRSPATSSFSIKRTKSFRSPPPTVRLMTPK